MTKSDAIATELGKFHYSNRTLVAFGANSFTFGIK